VDQERQTTRRVPDSASGELVCETTARPGDWFSIIVRADDGPTAFSNAIFVGR